MNTNTNINTRAHTPATPSETIKVQQSVMSEPLRPRWCIQRDENTVVPLIAMDELPEAVILKDLPIVLTVLEALKARMELITGDHSAHGFRYQLDQPINTQTVLNEEGHESEAQRIPGLTTNEDGIFDPMAQFGTMGMKKFCTFWMRTGNCNYMQTGCKYRHEIPKDLETLRLLGFREYPTWLRQELPIKPAPALHKSWRRQDGKPEFRGAQGHSNRAVASPAAAHRTPIILARGNSQASAGAPTQGPAASAQYNPNATAFTAPHQHFPTHANHMTGQHPFSRGGQSFLGNGAAENYQQLPAQKNTSPPSYDQSASQAVNGGRSGSSSPPKQPPISRPTNLGQSSVIQQQNNTGTSTRKVAPDYHIMNRASGISGGAAAKLSGKQAQNNARPSYSGMPNNWNPQTNAPTLMDISFIAPPSESTRSGSQPVYTPNYTPISASAAPIPKVGNAFGSLNGNATSDSRAGTPAHYNGNSFANNNNNDVRVKGRGPVQFGRDSPVSTDAGSDAVSITSPPPRHRVFFREPGQPEFVTNPPEIKSSQNGKAAHGAKKHVKKVHATNGGKSVKGNMSGNGYEVLADMHDQQ